MISDEKKCSHWWKIVQTNICIFCKKKKIALRIAIYRSKKKRVIKCVKFEKTHIHTNELKYYFKNKHIRSIKVKLQNKTSKNCKYCKLQKQKKKQFEITRMK